jgi:hypothetical protein
VAPDGVAFSACVSCSGWCGSCCLWTASCAPGHPACSAVARCHSAWVAANGSSSMAPCGWSGGGSSGGNCTALLLCVAAVHDGMLPAGCARARLCSLLPYKAGAGGGRCSRGSASNPPQCLFQCAYPGNTAGGRNGFFAGDWVVLLCQAVPALLLVGSGPHGTCVCVSGAYMRAAAGPQWLECVALVPPGDTSGCVRVTPAECVLVVPAADQCGP